MKLKLILLLGIWGGVFFANTGIAQQVSQGQYKSWQYFNRDTTAYLKYNWARASIYNQQHRNLSLKSFFDTLELPITAIEVKMISSYLVGLIIYVDPYEKVKQTPADKRASLGLTVTFSPHYIVADSYESKLPALKNRDRTKVDRVLVKWNNSYNKIIENLKYDYIVY